MCALHEENWQDWPKGEAANPAGSLSLERGNQTEKISLRGEEIKTLEPVRSSHTIKVSVIGMLVFRQFIYNNCL